MTHFVTEFNIAGFLLFKYFLHVLDQPLKVFEAEGQFWICCQSQFSCHWKSATTLIAYASKQVKFGKVNCSDHLQRYLCGNRAGYDLAPAEAGHDKEKSQHSPFLRDVGGGKESSSQNSVPGGSVDLWVAWCSCVLGGWVAWLPLHTLLITIDCFCSGPRLVSSAAPTPRQPHNQSRPPRLQRSCTCFNKWIRNRKTGTNKILKSEFINPWSEAEAST